MSEEVKNAIWYLRDYSTNMVNSDFREALEVVLNYIDEIENKNKLEGSDRVWLKERLSTK